MSTELFFFNPTSWQKIKEVDIGCSNRVWLWHSWHSTRSKPSILVVKRKRVVEKVIPNSVPCGNHSWEFFCGERDSLIPPYSQNHVKCSRPLCSLPGLQGQKIFADAIINFLIPFKSISDENSYDQLFINEVVKIFTFQFDESVIKFYLVKVFQILMKFW